MARKVGILGGTFDPVHNGHLAIAQEALERYELDFVLFVPAGTPPWKQDTTQASAQTRLTLLEEACAGTPQFRVSPLEVLRAGVSYTIDTLHELQTLFGAATQLFLIMGADAARDFDEWKDAALIKERATLVVLERELPVSSSAIRERIAHGESIEGLVPAAVSAFIKKYQVYGSAI